MAGIKRDAADAWFSKAIRLRDEYACRCCGKIYDTSSTGLHCAHIYGRAAKSTRWCTMNAVSLCYACHQYMGSHPIEFWIWLNNELGKGWLEDLRDKFNIPMKTNAALRKQIADHYRKQVRMLEQDSGHILEDFCECVGR